MPLIQCDEESIIEKMIESVSNYGRELKHSSCHEVWITFLKKEVDRINAEDLEKKYKKE